MENQLHHYHLGCGQRLQTDFLDFKSERRINFNLLSNKPSTKPGIKRNEINNFDSTNSVTGKAK